MTQLMSTEPAAQLTPGLGMGLSRSEGWLPLMEQPLLILVGVTGVGKSTVTQALAQAGLAFSLLANRRALTDLFIIPTIVRMDAQGGRGNPSCRVERFYYTRRYKELFPAGMVHVLSQLQIHPLQVRSPIIFDGLRGAQEVKYAVKLLPQARFIVLEAPDYIRLQRLLIRNDAFDRVAQSHSSSPGSQGQHSQGLTELDVPEARPLFSSDEIAEMLADVEQGLYSLSDLRDRLKIVAEERRHYDPDATRSTLEALAPDRTLAIDTTRDGPEQTAQTIVQFLESTI